MKLFLVRHGETTGNIGNLYQTSSTPLSTEGENQAKKVADRFKEANIDLIYSSAHMRAEETSKLISKETGAKIELWEKLMEIRRPSEVRGKRVDDPDVEKIMKEVTANFANRDWKYSDEENFFDLESRAVLVLDHLLTKHRDQTIICVSHGTFIKFLASKAIFRDKLTPEIFDLFRHHVWSANTGVTKLEYTERYGWRLSYWNDITHI
ncbi:MAG: histidine phosphatase family protein [Candidatus Woesebacteria bacterium]|nr:MAG: histidine phosphatase family protein [Candidatus Woesebacteria bacterium]